MLKKTWVLLIILIATVLVCAGCGRNTQKNAPEPENVNVMVAYVAFNDYALNLQRAAGMAYKRVQEQLGREATLSAGEVMRPVLNEAFINEVLADLRGQAPITSWCWQNARGVIVASDMPQTIGQHGGADDIVNVAYQNNVVYASNNVVSSRLEAPRALVIVIPVVDYGQVLGAFVGVISPQQDFGELLAPYIDLPRGIVIMNLQAGVIFSDNLDEIGRNYLSDEYYKPFGDLLLAVNKMRGQESGIVRYYFYISNTPYKDWYNARWVSMQYFSHTWRFIVREPLSLDLQTTY